jgi:hypothetical protein
MGDWYGFDFVKIGDDWKAGVVFQDESSNYSERQMQLTEEQKLLANAWLNKQEALIEEQEKMIKGFIVSTDSYEITEMELD